MKKIKIYESKKRTESNEEEINKYQKIFENKKIIIIWINNERINLGKKYLDLIFNKTGENFEKNISYIIFSVLNKLEIKNKNDIKIFNDSVIKISTPLDIPFEMKDSDFENI